MGNSCILDLIDLRRYLTVGAVLFAFLGVMLADSMMFDAKRGKILDTLEHDHAVVHHAVVQQYRLALEKTRSDEGRRSRLHAPSFEH